MKAISCGRWFWLQFRLQFWKVFMRAKQCGPWFWCSAVVNHMPTHHRETYFPYVCTGMMVPGTQSMETGISGAWPGRQGGNVWFVLDKETDWVRGNVVW